MSEQERSDRRYSENEISKILERATELQGADPGTSGGSGMTLAELEDVATEAGIDVGLVRRAAHELDTGVGRHTVWSRFLGEELAVVRDVTLAGEVPERCLEDMLGLIQSSASHHGHPSLIGRTLTWQGGPTGSAGILRIVVSARDGETHIRLEESFSQLAGGLYGGLGGGLGFGAGMGLGVPLGVALGSAVATVAFPAAWLAATYFGVRKLYQGIVRRRRNLDDDLFSTLVREAEDAIPPTPSNPD